MQTGNVKWLYDYVAAWEDYRITTKGPNLWTQEAFLNVISLHQFFDKAIDIVDGKFESVYRDKRVNKAVGGVPNSDHLRGLACDIKPRGMTVSVAARLLFSSACAGNIGPAVKMIIEPTWIHVSWVPLLTPVTDVFLMEKRGDKYPIIDQHKLV